MAQLTSFREQLGSQLNTYQSTQGDQYAPGITTPSEFFFQLQRHHEKLLQQYEFKIQEAEVLAKVVSEQAAKSTPFGE